MRACVAPGRAPSARRVPPFALAALLLAGPVVAQEPEPAEEPSRDAAERVGAHRHGGEAGHSVATEARLRVEDEPETGTLTVRLGPLSLPAGAGHHEVAQAPDRHLEVPFDGWILSYAPRLTDGGGEALPGRLLHHVAWWNTGRSDFLCPNKEEHIFGAGGEMNEWLALPGVGYRVRRGDRIRVSTMFHNPTAEDHREVWLEVVVRYQAADGGEDAAEAPGDRAAVYPVWFDVEECGTSEYDLPVGASERTGGFTLPVAGRLLGVGGHLHDYGRELVLRDETRDRELARLEARVDERGRILSMPVVPFLATGGYRLEAGDRVRVTARYHNPTGRALPDGAMGIVVGYFLPDDREVMDRFRREAERGGAGTSRPHGR